jgi:Holliday junction DNA helicase RuvA
MIARIEGTIVHTSEKFIIVDVSGVGYKLFLTTDSVATCGLGDHMAFWTYTAVRENSLDLYGFKDMEEMSFFELLLDVSGIGPKSALSILTVAPIDILKRAIATGDMSYLNKVSGIGKKTAEKIIIELRDKLKAHKSSDNSQVSLRDEGDVIEALKALGYSQNEARDTLRQIPETITGSSAKIKEALKILGKR